MTPATGTRGSGQAVSGGRTAGQSGDSPRPKTARLMGADWEDGSLSNWSQQPWWSRGGGLPGSRERTRPRGGGEGSSVWPGSEGLWHWPSPSGVWPKLTCLCKGYNGRHREQFVASAGPQGRTLVLRPCNSLPPRLLTTSPAPVRPSPHSQMDISSSFPSSK